MTTTLTPEEEFFSYLIDIVKILAPYGMDDSTEVINKINSRCIKGIFGSMVMNDIFEQLSAHKKVLKDKDYNYLENENNTIDFGDKKINEFIKKIWISENTKINSTSPQQIITHKDRVKIFRLLSRMYNIVAKQKK